MEKYNEAEFQINQNRIEAILNIMLLVHSAFAIMSCIMFLIMMSHLKNISDRLPL